jgi:hypothetical protein
VDPIKEKRIPGLRCWQLNIASKTITEIPQPEIYGKDWFIKPVAGVLYCQALNYKNADKRFGKIILLHLRKKQNYLAPDQNIKRN